MSRRVEHDGKGRLNVRFPFDRGLVDRIKALPNRRWHAIERFWSVPEDDVVLLVDALVSSGFRFDDATAKHYASLGGEVAIASWVAPPAVATAQAGLFDDSDASSIGASGRPAEGTSGAAPDDLTVAELNERVQQVLLRAFPAPIWVVGEVSGFNKNRHKRHVGFSLIDVDESGSTTSQVAATLFEGARRAIETKLKSAGASFELEDEVGVRLAVRIELYVPWGSYRVIVEDIDVAFTLGEAARRREEILRTLGAEGLLERNRELPLASIPLRVGVITSLGSDAYNDVLRTLQESGFGFRITVHGARVQGRATEPSLLNALDWFRHRADSFDAVLLCRGGGSRTDLSWFDTERIGRALADFPLPVISGIGHEQDHSVPDAVTRRAKTPTAAAALLVDRVREFLDRLETTGASVLASALDEIDRSGRLRLEQTLRLIQSARRAIQEATHRLARREHRAVTGVRALLGAARERLVRTTSLLPERAARTMATNRTALQSGTRRMTQAARRDCEEARRGLVKKALRLPPSARRAVREQFQQLESTQRRLRALDPQQVLDRGYTILRVSGFCIGSGPSAGAGRPLTDAADVTVGTRISAQLRRGQLELEVTETFETSAKRKPK